MDKCLPAYKEFKASLQELPLLLEFVKMRLQKSKLDPATIEKIEVAIEEACVNIVHYGYPDGVGIIQVSCCLINNGIQIVIQDDGIPFNPLNTPEKKPSPDKVGGHGINLIRKIMDQIEYRYENKQNILILSKYIPEE